MRRSPFAPIVVVAALTSVTALAQVQLPGAKKDVPAPLPGALAPLVVQASLPPATTIACGATREVLVGLENKATVARSGTLTTGGTSSVPFSVPAGGAQQYKVPFSVDCNKPVLKITAQPSTGATVTKELVAKSFNFAPQSLAATNGKGALQAAVVATCGAEVAVQLKSELAEAATINVNFGYGSGMDKNETIAPQAKLTVKGPVLDCSNFKNYVVGVVGPAIDGKKLPPASLTY
ncbi:MAG: hypothetical protein KIT84_12330 [Labilithrix sp.]|nr:hypothetical protein [Labilithrix sp.]MCW5811800.1 hypothetical protein [Labilithrix sp.]